MTNNIKLICFDLDKTLINQNSWYGLNLAMGVTHEEDQNLLERYLKNEFSYEEWIEKLLKIYLERGMANKENITKALTGYEYLAGAKEVVKHAKGKGYHVALISGSIDVLVDLVARDLEIELAEANNEFVFDENDKLIKILTYGEDTIAKLNHLEKFCDKLGIDITQCVCVGDGDNDIEMFRKTGKGITFKGSKIEKESWRVVDKLADITNII